MDAVRTFVAGIVRTFTNQRECYRCRGGGVAPQGGFAGSRRCESCHGVGHTISIYHVHHYEREVYGHTDRCEHCPWTEDHEVHEFRQVVLV